MNPTSADELFALIIEAPESEREALLAAVEDDGVRTEVRRLLDHHDRVTTDPHSINFLDTLDLSLAYQLVEPDEQQPERLGRFEVIRLIGRGASGTVFLARDPELGREVAIKLIASDLSTSTSAIRRFKEEARAASLLDHPNVVTVFEVGQADDERLFIAMAYHEGETLRDRLRRGPLAIEESLDIAKQIASGLVAAHARGIVHRDIKPENILLTSHGTRIVDFGIAKALHGDSTLTDAAIGTAAYMSPEQTRGSGVDHRTDIWSLGVVLYEMLAGARPFQAQAGDALVYGIRHDPPLPLADQRPDVPGDVLLLIDRCLAKNPDDRFQTAAGLVEALGQPARALALSGGRRPVRRSLKVAAAATALSLIGWWGWSRTGNDQPPESIPVPGVAVLPWRVTVTGMTDLQEGMVDLLSYSVDGVEGLRKISPDVVMTAWRKLGSPIDEQGRLRVASRVEASYLITGSAVQLAGGHISLIADVRDVARNRLRGSARVQGPADSVSALVDQLMLELLRLNLLQYDGINQPASLSTITTSSLPALKAFLAGEREFRVARWPEAARHYLRALDHDPEFARALFRLIKAIDWGADVGGRDGFIKRLEPLVGGLPDRDRMLILGEMGSRFPHANPVTQMPQIHLLEEMLSRFPDEVEGWVALGDRYYHDRGQLLLPPEGYREAFRQAIKLNPYFAEPYIHLIDDAFFMLDSTESRRLVTEFRQIDRGSGPCSLQLALDLSWGPRDARQKAMEALDTLPGSSIWNCIPRTGTHPLTPEAREKIWATVVKNLRNVDLVYWTSDYFVYRLRGMISRGNFTAVQEELASWEGAIGPTSWWPERLQIMLHLSGFRDPAAAHRAAKRLIEEPPSNPGTGISARFWVGLLAIEEGRWPESDRAINSLDSLGAELLRNHQDVSARAATLHARALRTFRALVNGGIADLPAMDTVIALVPPISIISPSATLRFMVGQLLLERRELMAARRYFRSFGSFDLMGTRTELALGQIAELQGRRGEAIEHYRRFLGWWSDADPEFQALVEEARAGLKRLGVSSP